MMNVSAVTYYVGVKVGDWAKYDFLFDWTSTDPQSEPDMEQEKQVDYTRVEVKEVSGTTVTLRETTHFKNGSIETMVYRGDIKRGMGNLSVQLIASNLKEGDRLSEDPDVPVINRTRFEKYAGATREVNLVRSTVGTPGLGNWSILDAYWDKKTGFLCELAIYTNVFTENYESESFTQWKMIETNLWQPETNPTIAIPGWVGAVISVIIAIVVVYSIFKKRSKK
jgi:hypothetical protein